MKTRLLQSIKRGQTKSFIIEFLGLPGAGKSTFNATLMQDLDGIFEHFTTEEILCDSQETPYSFSEKVIARLNHRVSSVPFSRPLLMERGIIDEDVWLTVHKKLGNISSDQYTELHSRMPQIPDQIDYYAFLFEVDIAESLQRRSSERRIPDTWGLNIETLRALREGYQQIADSGIEVKMVKIDASRSRSEVYAQVRRNIDTIIKQHIHF